MKCHASDLICSETAFQVTGQMNVLQGSRVEGGAKNCRLLPMCCTAIGHSRHNTQVLMKDLNSHRGGEVLLQRSMISSRLRSCSQTGDRKTGICH